MLEDGYGKRLVVQVRTTPIEQQKLGEILNFKNAILTGETTDVSVMLVADKMPVHLKSSCEHNGVSWKEVTLFQVREYLEKKNDRELLDPLK